MSEFNRRKFLGKTAALLSAMVAAGFISTSAMAMEATTTGQAVTDTTVTVGILRLFKKMVLVIGQRLQKNLVSF